MNCISFQKRHKDHLGNNRELVTATGITHQVSHYYPYGGLMADISTNQDMQRFRFQGKELDHFENIDWNDHGARHADLQTGRWNTVDPLAEKYYSVSPYNNCNDNPANNIDIDGLYPIWNGKTGSETAYYDSETGKKLAWSQVNNYIHYGNYDGTQKFVWIEK